METTISPSSDEKREAISRLTETYVNKCRQSSDIFEHLPTLAFYAAKCDKVIELGVRGVVSTYAFLYGLMKNESTNQKCLLMNDIEECEVSPILELSSKLGIEVKYQWISDLDMEIDGEYDMTFIDTMHVYGQLKRELEKYSKITKKYIAMHDTEVDKDYGELIRSYGYTGACDRVIELSSMTKIPAGELLRGLQPAIDEFLTNHPEWVLEQKYTNNNGLTILRRQTV